MQTNAPGPNRDDPTVGEDESPVLDLKYFMAMPAVHGNHQTYGGTIHRMEPGQTVTLLTVDDSWIPNSIEPFHDQVLRVNMDKVLERVEQVRLRSAMASLSSPLYKARMERLGLDEYLRTYSHGGVR